MKAKPDRNNLRTPEDLMSAMRAMVTRNLVLLAIETGADTRGKLLAATRLTEKQLERLLVKLREDGDIHLVGDRRSARYLMGPGAKEPKEPAPAPVDVQKETTDRVAVAPPPKKESREPREPEIDEGPMDSNAWGEVWR